MWRTPLRLACGAALLVATAFAQSDTPTFTTFQRYPGNDTTHAAQADLNSDGALDFVFNDGKTWLSNGDGTYHLGPTPAGVAGFYPVGSGDFDGDGKADVVFSSGTTAFSIAYGNGDGTWRTTRNFAGIQGSYGNIIQKALASDFNKDGKQDLAVFVEDGYGPGQKKVGLLINTGTDFTFTGFAAIEYTYHNSVDNNDYPWLIGDFALGDFDADGKADVVYSVRTNPANHGPSYDFTKTVALFGDGAGHLGSAVQLGTHQGYFRFSAGDIDQDGRSDVAGVQFDSPCPGEPCTSYVVYFGSPGRTFTLQGSPATVNEFDFHDVVIADFNGDRLMDIADITADSGSSTFGFRVGTHQAGTRGSFSQGNYYALGPYTFGGPAYFFFTGDYSRDMKPDLMTVGTSDFTMDIVTNTTPGGGPNGYNYKMDEGFPDCRQPGGRGLNVCVPQPNGVYTEFYNRVFFSASASDHKPLRKIELWLDGKKADEQFFAYSNYAYFNRGISMTLGNHTATFYAAGYDNSLMKKSVTFSMAGSGESCFTSSATTVTICQPVQGSTVNSPVQVDAVGGSSITYMELWEGGIKRFGGAQQYIDVQLNLAPGMHTATVFGKVGSTTTDKKQVTFTVSGSGGGTCAPSSATTAVICSPVANSTVSSPAAVNAKGGSSVNNMEAWIDGSKKGSVNGNNLSLSVPLGAGQHKLTVFAKVNGTTTDTKVEYFNVQ